MGHFFFKFGKMRWSLWAKMGYVLQGLSGTWVMSVQTFPIIFGFMWLWKSYSGCDEESILDRMGATVEPTVGGQTLRLTANSRIPESWRKCGSYDFAAKVALYMAAKNKGPTALKEFSGLKFFENSLSILIFRLKCLVQYAYEILKLTWTKLEGDCPK